MSSSAKNFSTAHPDTAESSDVEGEESKPALPPKHILKRPIVATSRKNVITLMHQVMEEMGATGSLIQVESLAAATEAHCRHIQRRRCTRTYRYVHRRSPAADRGHSIRNWAAAPASIGSRQLRDRFAPLRRET